MPSPLQLRLIGGPLGGTVHELDTTFGTTPPNVLGLRQDENSSWLHWYKPGKVKGEAVAHYDTSEFKPRKKPPQDE